MTQDSSSQPPVEVPAPNPHPQATASPATGRTLAWVACVTSIVALGAAALAWFQLHSAVDQLRQSQSMLVEDVAALRKRPLLDLSGAATVGPANALVTLVEFSDYECPFCRRHFTETMPQIEANYIANGKIQYAFFDLPVDELHPQAIRAHEAAHCAAEQNKYWDMHRRLFSPAGSHTPEALTGMAKDLGLDVKRFGDCTAAGAVTKDIRTNSRKAGDLGATGTPAFYIGRRDPATNQLTVVRSITGAQPYEAFAKALDQLLAQTK